MTFIEAKIKALKADREYYRQQRDMQIMGSSEFFFYVGMIQKVDEELELLKERT